MFKLNVTPFKLIERFKNYYVVIIKWEHIKFLK